MQGPADPRASDPPPLRGALVMGAVGILLLVAGFAVADERWQLVSWILGGLMAGTAALTIAYSRLAPHVSTRRHGAGR